jgi:superfamily II DNA/RNA helicase
MRPPRHDALKGTTLLTDMTFGALGVPKPLLTVLAADGKTTSFPIQEATLSDALAGRDLLGRGKTGSGKTLAFAIPMVARLSARGAGHGKAGRPRGLVLAPTRELATQIDAVIKPLARAYGMTTTTIFGGVPQSRQVSALRAGAEIIVACPGRLEDLMKQGHVHLDNIEVTVIDEADHMADLGFLPGVTRILTATPPGGQRMLFSATLDNGVHAIVKRFLHDPLTHSVDEENSHVSEMTHHVFHLDGAEAKRAMINALASGTGRRILFMRTKHHAKKLAKQLSQDGIPAVDLHGNLSQGARDRNLAAFGAGTVRVLVATDVAARGVHVDDVQLVVHVDPPMEHKSYLHRSGRTARAGNSGDVVTLVLPEQRRDTATLLRMAAIDATPQRVHAGSPEVGLLVGERALHVPYVARPEDDKRGGNARRSPSNNASRGQSRAPRSATSQSATSQSGAPKSGASRGDSGGRSTTYSTSTPRAAAGLGGSPGGAPRRSVADFSRGSAGGSGRSTGRRSGGGR